MDKRYQVFISSTFKDLEEHRRIAIEQVLNMGHLPVGMESFQASNEDQWSYIKRRIETSDYYLVIVAERYGSCDQEGVSFTEKEYQLAVSLNVPVAAFLIHEDQRDKISGRDIEAGKKEQIDRFRELCQRKMVKFWRNRQELSGLVGNALYGLIADHPRDGLVSAKLLPSHDVLAEITRLSSENARLLAENTELKATNLTQPLSPHEQALFEALQNTTIKTIADEAGLTIGITKNRASASLQDFSIWQLVSFLYSLDITSVEPYHIDYSFEMKLGWKFSIRNSRGQDFHNFWLEVLVRLVKLKLFEESIEPNNRGGHNTVYRFTETTERLILAHTSPIEILLGKTSHPK